MPYTTEKIRLAYKTKYNLRLENRLILLIITNGKKWHYLAVKSLSALLRRITSNNNGNFYCINCLHSFRTENNLDYSYVEMPKEDNKIFKKPWRKIYASYIFCLC